MPLSRSLVALLACVALLVCARPAQAQNEDALRQILKNQFEQHSNQAHRLRKLDQHHYEDLFQLHLEKGLLVLRTTLHSTDNEVCCDIEGSHAITTLRVMNGDDHDSKTGVVPAMFQLVSMTFADDKLQTLRITSQGNNMLQIIDQEQSIEGAFETTQLMQSEQAFFMPGMNQPTVNLMAQISYSRNGRGQPGANMNAQAEDFATLLRTERQQVDTYVRPLLSRLGQDALFVPDATLMTQVFSELWASDPKLAGQITQRLPELDADDYQVREKALNELRRLGRPIALEAMHLDRGRLSAEQTMRLDSLVGDYFSTPASVIDALRKDRSFLIDCLYSDDSRACEAALDHLRSVLGKKIAFDLKTTGPDRMLAVRALRESIEPAATTKP